MSTVSAKVKWPIAPAKKLPQRSSRKEVGSVDKEEPRRRPGLIEDTKRIEWYWR